MTVLSGFSAKWLFHELRRRRVFQTVALYIVGSWVALQVSEMALTALDIPERAIRYVWIGAFLLFPLSLIFGWHYDISSGGIERTLPAGAADGADRSLRRSDRWVIGSLSSVALVVIALMVVQIDLVEPELAGPPRDNSIAVMPFDVCGDHFDDKVLAGGLTSEVINRLAERDRLKVIARTSSHALSEQGSTVSFIAGLLRVQYVLTGAVCRDGLDLTLEVELADYEGFIVWRESYAQVVNRFDQIEQPLATMVAHGVAAELGDILSAPVDEPINRLAYEHLVIGREFADRRDFDMARAAFDKALQHEPEYAEAIFHLAMLVEKEAFSEGELGYASLEEAWPIGKRALDLATRQLAEGRADFHTHSVLAVIRYQMGKWDQQLTWRHARELEEGELSARLESVKDSFAEAEKHARTALVMNPSNTGLYELLGYILERQGIVRRKEALDFFEQGLARDPFNTKLNRDVSARWAARGRFRQAMELLERFDALPQVPRYSWMARMELQRAQEYLDEKCALLIEMLLTDPGAIEHAGNFLHLMWFPGELAYLGMHEEAEAWFRRVEKIPAKDGWASVVRQWGVDSYLDEVGRRDADLEDNLAKIAGMSDEEILENLPNAPHWLLMGGELERAIRLLESQQQSRFDSPLRAERRAAPLIELAGLYQAVGRERDAQTMLLQVTDDLEGEYNDGIRHPTTLGWLATAYVLMEEDEAALEMFRKAVDYHFRSRCDWKDPLGFFQPWARLRDDQRLTFLCQMIDADLEQQAERVRTILAGYDVDEVLAPVMASATARVSGEQQED